MRIAILKYAVLLTAVSCASRDARPPADSQLPQANSPPPAAISAAPGPGPRSPGIILFIGTSLTAGLGLEPDSAYPQQVQRMIDSAGLRYEVVNAGVSGETSSALLRRLDWLMRQPAAVVVIETGANDGLRGIPVETMRDNIQSVVGRIRAAQPDARLALAQMEAPPNLGVVYTSRFRAVYPEVARRNGIALLPFILEGVAGRRELNQGDGIHPNLAGERIVARNVWRGLKPLLR